jgi:hypothetical protein
MRCIDDKGRELFVDRGIGHPPVFMTFYRDGRRRKRFKSPAVPPRSTDAEASADLLRLAVHRGWRIL